MGLKCVLHGSFRKHFAQIQKTREIFEATGIEVLAPQRGDIADIHNGFALFEDQLAQDPRLIELQYLKHLMSLGSNGFSYFVNPEGYIGISASYELGIAQTTNTPCYFAQKPMDHPVYYHKNSLWSAESLAGYIAEHQKLPGTVVKRSEQKIHTLWQSLLVPSSIVATGAIIEHQPRSSNREKEILLVKTHKWQDRYSIVGGKVRRNERLQRALLREVREETGLEGEVGRHITTFDELKNSGYYTGYALRVFVDNVVRVSSKNVVLNDEAQSYIWARPDEALKSLDIEPNARHTLKLYTASLARP